MRPWVETGNRLGEHVLSVHVRDAAGDEALMRACAALRVESFYSYQDDSALAILFGPGAAAAELAWADARMRVEAARSSRMQALGMQVTCLAAVCSLSEAEALHRVAAGNTGLSGLGHYVRGIRQHGGGEVVGTLDIHVGDRLPGEPLEGALPGGGHYHTGCAPESSAQPWWAQAIAASSNTLTARAAYAATSWGGRDSTPRWTPAPAAPHLPFIMPPADAPEPFDAPAVAAAAAAAAIVRSSCDSSRGERAYLFNVCVTPSARRQGVAAALLESAHAMAAAAGVKVLYVHVEEGNASARRLYTSAGFDIESGEPAWLALRLGRPRRLLLRKRLATQTFGNRN